MLTELEKKVISAIQDDIPVVLKPYKVISEKIGISEDELLQTLQDLCSRGIIRRLGATLRHQKSGYEANAMTAWQVEEDHVETVGRKMAEFREVSHCYRRNPNSRWPYNLYTMIHARDEAACMEIARNISKATDVSSYKLLFSRRELKKTSMEYFPNGPDDIN
jgi:siroheme decarboxylase